RDRSHPLGRRPRPARRRSGSRRGGAHPATGEGRETMINMSLPPIVKGWLLAAACASAAMSMSMSTMGCFQTPSEKARSVLPRAPAEQAKCRVAASQSSPLVTEWPASERANMEMLLRNGTVAFAYSGCSMRLLPECRVRGEYHWQRTTPSTDSLEINDSDELFAKLPL